MSVGSRTTRLRSRAANAKPARSLTERGHRTVREAVLREIGGARRMQIEADRWNAALRAELADCQGIGSDLVGSRAEFDPHAAPRGILRGVLWGVASWALIVAIAAVTLLLFS
jgi:hypothetical protein